MLELGMRAACIIHPGFLNAYWFMGSPFYFWFSWSLGAALADAHLYGRPLPLVNFSPGLWILLAVGSYHIRPLQPFVFPLYAVLTTIIMPAFWPEPSPGFGFPDSAKIICASPVFAVTASICCTNR
jgi:hypothetical protein